MIKAEESLFRSVTSKNKLNWKKKHLLVMHS
jgi:hypothetical protein